MKHQEIIDRLRNDEDYYGGFGKQYLSNSDIHALLRNPLAFKEDMDRSYQAANNAAPVDQDKLSDTGSDNNSDISTGSDSSTNSDYGSKLLSRGPV